MMYDICRRYRVNKKVFDVVLEWIPRKKGGRAEPIPIEEMRYAPHIGINGERVINGCGWSILCYVYDYLDFEPLKTKAYIRFLNTDSAQDILAIGTNIELYEGVKKVAIGTIVDNSNFEFILN